MKKITLFIITIFFSFSSFSQLLPPPGIEGFENTAGPDLAPPTTPSPWTIGTGEWAVFDNGVGLGKRWEIRNTPTTDVYQGLNAAYMDREFIGQGNTSEDYLATPLVTVPANGQLRFFTKSTIALETATIFQIKIAPATGTQLNPSDYTLVQQWTEATLTTTYNIYEQKIVDLSLFAGQQVYIAFVMKYTQNVPGLSGDRWLVDNVQLVPNCVNPANLNVNPITFNGGSLTWTSQGSTSWEVEILPVGSTPTGIGTIYNGTLPYVVTNLLPNTNYKFLVRSVCSPGVTSAWVGPYNFTTTTAPPVCGGNFVDAAGPTTNYVNNSDATVTICPINPGDVVTVTFTSFNTEEEFDGLYVFNGNSITSPQISSANNEGNVPGGLPGSFWGNTIPGPFTSSATNGCLTFRFRSDGLVNAAGWIANISCTLAPTCPAPYSLSNNSVTSTTVNLGWTNPNTANSWHIIALPCGSTAPNAGTTGFTVANSNPFTLNGLTPETCYDIYVRAVCSLTDISGWSALTTITTQVAPPVCGGIFTDLGGINAQYQNETDNTVTICPVNAGDVVTVTFTSFSVEEESDGLYVYNGNSITDPQFSSGNNGGFIPGNLPGAFWGNTIIGPFTSSSTDGCLTFRFISGFFGTEAGWNANVTCAIAPTCPSPFSLSSNTVTSTSGVVSWNNPNTATSWQVLYLPCGSAAPTSATVGQVVANSNPFTLTGLTADTCYDVYIKAICSSSDSSSWSSSTSFTTQVTPPICGGIFTDPLGANQNYLSNTNSTVTICPIITGEQVTLNFTSFSTEVNWDGLYVYNGNSILAPQISSTNGGGNVPGGLPGSYWGNTIPGPFTGDSPNGCLTFRFVSDGSFNLAGWVANVVCLPPPTCPRPTLVSVTNVTQTTATVNWTEVGPATTWNVLILPFGSPIPDASTTGWISTTSNPYIATGLNSATQYVAYVRSRCTDTDISFWSTPGVVFATLITNDECINAVNVPVNGNTSCALTVAGSLIGATGTALTSNCFGNPNDDVWFQFTAVTANHYVGLNNIINGNAFNVVYQIYSGTCGSLTSITCNTNALTTLTGLIPGQVYFIRIFSSSDNPVTTTFNVCVGTVPPPITSNTTQFTNVQLIEDVLLDTTCASVTNITSSTGTNFGSTNGIGYFNKNGSSFPFQEGIVLTTGNALSAPGPNTTTLGDGNQAWIGDTDLEAIILAATGLPMNSRNATKLEFDFVPLTNNISFNFIFASEEYGTFQCGFSDAFAFLLTNIATGTTTNLAIVPGTTLPISVVTIRDNQFNTGCASSYQQFFDEFYQLPLGVSPLGAPINYNGTVVPLTATSPVIPGSQYHIKLVIADRLDNNFDSAVFLEGGSLNIGNIELGGDFLQANGTALCNGESYTITSDLSPTLYTFIWTLNGTTIAGATGPNLTITSPGVYALTANYTNTTCASTDSVTIEYYDVVVPGTPNTLYVCNNLGVGQFNLAQNNIPSIGTLNPATHTVTYYLNSEDANAGTPSLPNLYTNTTPFTQTIYVRVTNTAGCFGVTQFNLVVQDLTPQFTITPSFSVCPSGSGLITVTPTNFNPQDVTYSWTLNGIALPFNTSTITANAAGTYIATVNNSGCTNTGTTIVTITPLPTPDDPTDVISCGNYTLPILTNGNYFSGSNGTGTAYFAGNTISASTTLYVYSQSGTTPNCTAENSFSITINNQIVAAFTQIANICQNTVAPILPTTSLNGVIGIWNPSTIDSSVEGTTVYTFTPNSGLCASGTTMSITVNPTPVLTPIQNVIACASYTLPALTIGNYYPQSNGQGTQIAAGTVITSSQTLYVFAQSNTIPNCTDEESFNITINPQVVPTFTAIGPICQNTVPPTLPTISNNGITGTWNATINTANIGSTTYTFTPINVECATTTTLNISVLAPVTATFTQINAICQNNVAPVLPTTSSNGVIGIWNPSTITTANFGTTVYTFTANSGQCATGTTMNITINPIPVLSVIQDVDACTSYTLPALTLGNYYPQTNGQGTQIPAGTIISSSQTIYVFAQSNTIPNCTDEESFDVTINPIPQFAIAGGCQGSSYVIEASPINNSFTNNVNYSWTNAAGTIVGNTQSITVTVVGNFTCLITVNGTGCLKSEVFTANDITCSIPKGISPNADGLNDSFDLTGLNVTQLSIFNRYGSKVYAKGNYSKEWFGQADNGNDLPDGTYYYVIETGTSENRSGWVYINRENK
ncbi:choice-of-anchor L domain-containing protein [Flavobacterium sp.]|uniref:choice-of-anchor L domain-containing protein n=1 Tax=Flavobacterium sp. TaxID=239 RepID=UPI003753A488